MFDVGHYFTRDHGPACSLHEDELIQDDHLEMLLNPYLPLAGKWQFSHFLSVPVGKPAKITDASIWDRYLERFTPQIHSPNKH